MNEVRLVTDRHFVVPLTDEEHIEVKMKALDTNLTVKKWVQIAILEKLKKEGE